jgi:hypothetical protein
MKSVSIPVLATFCGSFTGRSMDGRQDANQQQWVTSRCCAGRTQRPYGKRLSSVACFLLVVLMLILGSRKQKLFNSQFFFKFFFSPFSLPPTFSLLNFILFIYFRGWFKIFSLDFLC